MRFQNLPESYTVEVERYYIGKHIENYYASFGYGLWALLVKKNDRCEFVRQPLEGREEIELSYLVEREFWN